MNRVVWSCLLLVLVAAACSTRGGSGASPAIAGERQLDDATVGVAYTVTLSLLGDAPHTVTVAQGALPPGVSLSSAGLLSGTPTEAGSFEFTLRVENTVGESVAERAIRVSASGTAPSIAAPALLNEATVLAPYANQFSATGSAPFSWSISAGALPSGVELVAETGALAGTPTALGMSTFTVAVENGFGSDARQYTLNVVPIPVAPTITGPGSLPTAALGVAYSQQFAASGTMPITWTVAGALPDGLMLDAASGVLSGTPTTVQMATFDVQATNVAGMDVETTSLEVSMIPTLGSLSPVAGVAGGTIALNGTGFAASVGLNTVTFGAVSATVLSASTTQLVVQVPVGLGATESVSVTVNGFASGTQMFTSDATAVVFVDADATGAADGTSWRNAYTSLSTALAAAGVSNEIWVAAGTYNPGANVADTFALNGDKLYGGFAATEALRSQQDVLTNTVFLTGDVNGDSVGFTNMGDNNENVVRMSGSSVLDGFTITQGDATADGGGIFVALGANTNLANLTLTTNRAGQRGGGVFVDDNAVANIRDSVVSNNQAGTFGGGVCFRFPSIDIGGSGNVQRVVFADNSASSGGGAADGMNASNAFYQNCLFVDNAASTFGGGLYNDFTVGNHNYCTFFNNSANSGGAWYRAGFTVGSANSCVFWGNSAITSGDQIDSESFLALTDCVLQAGGLAGAGVYSLVFVTNSDPLFVNAGDPDGADNRFATTDDGLRPGAGSSTLDAGSAGGPSNDLSQLPRPQGAGHDIGCYERQ